MSRMNEHPPYPDSERANHSMKMTFPSQFRLDFRSPLNFAVAYSVFP